MFFLVLTEFIEESTVNFINIKNIILLRLN